MKHNAEKATSLIEQAIQTIGGDFALANAKRYLIAGLEALQDAQSKREKRDNNIKQEAQKRQKLFLSAEEAKRRIKTLDDMLKQEQLKLIPHEF